MFSVKKDDIFLRGIRDLYDPKNVPFPADYFWTCIEGATVIKRGHVVTYRYKAVKDFD
mgnify:FL=1